MGDTNNTDKWLNKALYATLHLYLVLRIKVDLLIRRMIGGEIDVQVLYKRADDIMERNVWSDNVWYSWKMYSSDLNKYDYNKPILLLSFHKLYFQFYCIASNGNFTA